MRVTKAAVDAAAERFDAGPGFDVSILARYALEAAMPHIRKQIADEIRAEMPPLTSQRLGQTIRSCFEAAARIAEGENK